MLNSLQKQSLPKGTISFSTSDDAALYPLDNDKMIIQSVDFFTPIVDDPKSFGKIAAANSLSDIYAMGGHPLFALNIAAFPSEKLPLEILSEIINGGFEIAKQAGIPILGGHTIKDNEPKYGLVVTGQVKKENITKNNTAKEGDILILTKPIGTGIISTAIKKELAPQSMIDEITHNMSYLNKSATEVMNEIGVNACTDITGYGLIGHLMEMCKGSKLSAKIEFNSIPFIKGTFELAQNGIIPGGTKKNLNFYIQDLSWESYISKFQLHMLSDAQTSGGLLMSIPEKKAPKLVQRLNEAGTLSAAIIGQIYNSNTNIHIL